jgi:uncharacterized membrane protein
MSSVPNRLRPRIESLTDLIFGLALSIGALGLLNSKPGSIQDVLSSIAFFGLSFLILITIWLRYTDVMSILPTETSGSRTLNIFLLFLVALEPYLFNLVLGSSGGLSASVGSAAYAVDIGAIYAILASFNNILASEDRKLVEAKLIRKYRIARDLQLLATAILWVSIIPQFYTLTLPIGGFSVPLRYVLWVATLFFSRGTWILKRL